MTEPVPEPEPDPEPDDWPVIRALTDDEAERIIEELPSSDTPVGEVEKQVERVEVFVEGYGRPK